MKTWFEETAALPCSLDTVAAAVSDIGAYFVQTTLNRPDMTTVVLMEQRPGLVTLKTSDGVVKRTNVTVAVTDEGITVEYAEEYWAGRQIAAISHVMDEFTPAAGGVSHTTTISGVDAPGFAGFFERSLKVDRLGADLMAAQRTHLEGLSG